jgi:hypothetical protein
VFGHLHKLRPLQGGGAWLSLKIGKLGPSSHAIRAVICRTSGSPAGLFSCQSTAAFQLLGSLSLYSVEGGAAPRASVSSPHRSSKGLYRVAVLVRYRPAYIVHLQSFDPWLRQGSSWTSPPLDLWKLARWPVAMSVGVATCESSVVVLASTVMTSNLPSLGGFNSRPRTVFSVVPARAA